MRSARIAAMLALTLAAGLAPMAAGAHGRSLSYSTWEVSRLGAQVRVRLPQLELTRLPPERLGDVGGYLTARLELVAADQPCVPTRLPRALVAPEGWVSFEWRVRCADPDAPRALRSALFLDVAPSHLHFARVRLPDGALRERVLSEAEPSWALAPAAGTDASEGARGTPLTGYLALGIEHIVTGWDHVAFVLALLLLARTLREVTGLVTAFTVAHSLTLGLATLGVVRPEPSAVEALIGFSIALVAAENAWLLAGRDRLVPAASIGALLALAAGAAAGHGGLAPATLLGLALFTACHFALLRRAERPAVLRAAVAFGFGLVHGFGFAGVLAELELPRMRLVPALFGFNVGVELGQLGVVVVVWPLLHALESRAAARWHRGVAEWASAGICGLGLFWFVTRTYG